MSKERKKTIPVQAAFDEWRKDPDYVREFKSLEDEFALAQLFISARGAAGLTQQELAEKMITGLHRPSGRRERKTLNTDPQALCQGDRASGCDRI